MMEMVNVSRIGVAAMGAGIARRCFFDAAIRASRREAFGRRLCDWPLLRRDLLRLQATSEAAAAILLTAGATVSVPRHRESILWNHSADRRRRIGRVPPCRGRALQPAGRLSRLSPGKVLRDRRQGTWPAGLRPAGVVASAQPRSCAGLMPSWTPAIVPYGGQPTQASSERWRRRWSLAKSTWPRHASLKTGEHFVRQSQ
jgi:hypothetical protein